MLDLFTIFTKGGIVLWCFRGTNEIFAPSVNALIRSVILQERTGKNAFDHNGLTLQYKLDNEFELVFVVAFQKILQLGYVDKFLSDIHLEFRDKYKNELRADSKNFRTFDFQEEYTAQLLSQLSPIGCNHILTQSIGTDILGLFLLFHFDNLHRLLGLSILLGVSFAFNHGSYAALKTAPNLPCRKAPKSPQDKAGKKPRVWELGGTNKDLATLDRSKDKPEDVKSDFTANNEMIGTMRGGIQDLEVESEDEEEYSESSSDEADVKVNTTKASSKKTSGMFSLFRGLVGSKNLTQDDMQPTLEKLKDHLISKNVASDIAHKLCDSVATKLEGKVLGTFDTIAATVKTTLTEALVQILSPKRRVDILRDCLEAKKNQRPYVMTFCGVNGVGKSTNLAKICFWLIENNMSVLIAACDTFRAGAVEQLRTHTRHLNALHPAEKHGGLQMVQLYEKGY
uniref:SRP54-type proteins GTP-binding domain-containing protein n=1 Tax=Phlebotomus papatasi TaxID=29031 RepID=A0A1B0DFG1_PHLPP